MFSMFDPASLAVFTALGVMSVMALTVSIYKALQFRRLGVGHNAQGRNIVDNWLGGRPDEAMRLAASRENVLARVLQSVMSGLRARPSEPAYAEELGRQSALIELAAMSRRMRLLEAVVQAAPMLGLLGTVIGMIDAFGTLAVSQGAVDPALLAGGIWTALTTTAVGLAIALATYFVATYFESRIETERQSIEAIISATIHGRVDAPAR